MLKVAIVGCGFMGRMHANVYSGLEGAELVAVLDNKSVKAEVFEKDFGVRGYGELDDLLANEEIDVVDICLPTYLHKDFTVAAAKAGKHVFCEKPMALTLGDADAMIAACEEAGVRLMIGHCIRFWPEYALLKEIKDDGRLGKMLSINLTRYGEFPSWSEDNWLADESKAGGGALDMHIHDTDYALFLFGKPTLMESFGSSDEKGVGQIFTTMRYPDFLAHTEGGWNLPPKTPFKMAFRAIFEKGAAIMDGGPMTIYKQGGEPETPVFAKMEAAGGGNISDLGGYHYELAYFVDCLTHDKPFEITTPQSSRDSLEVTLAEIAMAKAR